jgi:hypothetical protein
MAEPVVKIPLAPQLPVTGITALVTPNGAANAVTVVNAIERPRGVENSAIRCIDQNVSRVLVLVTAVWNDPLDQWEGNPAMHTLTPDLAELAGSWRLLSHGTTYTDTNERLEVFGSKPDGRMVLTPAGRIMFLFMKANRQVPRSDADRAALLDGLVAYSGTVRMDGPGRFITTIDLSGNPAWSGDQLRLFTLDGDRLTILTPEQTFPLSNGRLMVSELIWERERL